MFNPENEDHSPKRKRAKLQSLIRGDDIISQEREEDIIDLTESESHASESQAVEPKLLQIRNLHIRKQVDKKYVNLIAEKVSQLNPTLSSFLRKRLIDILYRWGVEFIGLYNISTRCDYSAVIVSNFEKCLKEMDFIVDNVNRHYWNRFYLIPNEVLAGDDDLKFFFRHKVFHMLLNLKKHIYKNNWDSVRRIMAEFDFNATIDAGNNVWYSKLLAILYSFRWSQLFDVMMQLFVLTKTNIDDQMKAIARLLSCFKTTLLSNPKITRNSFPMYLAAATVVSLAHDHTNSLKELQKFRILPKDNDAEYNRILTIYGFLVQFRLLILEEVGITNYQWNNTFENILNVVSNTNEHPTQLLCLVKPLITLGNKLDRKDEVVEAVTVLCIRAPALLPFVATIMSTSNYMSSIGPLISEVIDVTPAPFLSQFPLILHYIGHRAILSQHSFHFEMVDSHVRMLLEFLDHGRNRARGEAWTSLLLHFNAMGMVPQWLRNEWKDRVKWWPRFHLKVDIGEFTDDREKCFDFLKQQCGSE